MSIESILTDKGISYRAKNNELILSCFSGLHEDKNPSLHYNLDKNIFNCFSCGFKGSYKDFMKYLGINEDIREETVNRESYRIKKLREKFNRKILTKMEVRLPNLVYPYINDFKGVDSKILEEFKCFTTPELELQDYICFPIYQHGILRFIESRYKILSNTNTGIIKYKRTPTGSSTRDMLFPLDKIEANTKEIILVEGLFDMLNLWQHGIKNVLCIFGANNFHEAKAEQLEDKGIRKVIIMLDGDAAGYSGAIKAKEILEKVDIEARIIELQQGKDPGSLSKDEINKYLNQEIYE